ncbi:MAG: ring-hydroxylating oxygenase subunit alpha [Rhodospirillales bacterium 24-66-33]|nr:MAG: ring-hydroxylating oxygenase subunit alpha [Rhodospirillales bacterium 35-66-84]OYZ94806.1 MAG: ring-hydroxylating oxygenase subunit alpha [Rhodospirillales bacterium 24-66-33]OZB26119.1 MAG: ring-hydroxylating oxygenase subunit alpha [Rhodospirillales bacterium 39-66-50]
MMLAAENAFLTQSGPGTPMGDLMRRFWMPALLSEELPERDGPPKKIRVLGEDLLAFRQTDGRIGIVEPHCPHRGANLYFGRNEACGLRCSYHGWKFDIDGNCVDLPTSPPESGYKDTIKLLAYPTREWADMIWVYMGPRESMPELPQLELGLVPAAHRYVSKKRQDCNWVQSLEGAIDTAHFSFLHAIPTRDEATRLDILRKTSAIGQEGGLADRSRWVTDDPRPKFRIQGHDAGLVIAAGRKTDTTDIYWRIAQYLAPNHALVPVAFPGEVYHGQTWVPVDDTSCWIYTYSWVPDRPLSNAERAKYASGLSLHAEIDEHYVPKRNMRNDYLIDRELQKTLSYTGVSGVSDQDAAIQDSQGAIQDRTREHLGPTDVGIIEFRKLVMAAARALQQGEPPRAPAASARYAVRAGGWIAAAEKDLTTVMMERFGHRHGYVGGEYGLPE